MWDREDEAELRQHSRPLDRAAIDRALEHRDASELQAQLLPAILEVFSVNLRTVELEIASPFVPEVLHKGRVVPFLVPSPEVYAHDSWKWDLVFASMVSSRAATFCDSPELSNTLQRLAEGCVLAALANQLESGPDRGLVPHMNIRSQAAAELFGSTRRSWITQPPVIPLALAMLANGELRTALLPAVCAEHDFWLRERLAADGLPFTIHPWETGEDASADQDDSLAPFMGDHADNLGLQTVHAGEKDEATKIGRFQLLLALRALGDERTAAHCAELFAHKSPGMAAHLVRALRDTADWLEPAAGDRYRRAAQAIADHTASMWSGDFYLSKKGDALIPTRVASAFLPLYAGIPSLDQATRMLDALRDPEQFATRHPVPTLAQSDARYRSRQYWRGSTWININYLILDGLCRYRDRATQEGRADLAEPFAAAAHSLGWSTLELAHQGFLEYYDSADSDETPGAPERFTWSTLLLLVGDVVRKFGFPVDNSQQATSPNSGR